MSRLFIVFWIMCLLALASTACETILGINDHGQAPLGDSGSSAGAAVADAATSGVSGDGSPDSAPPGNETGPVPLCPGGAGACVVGGVFSMGRTPDMAGGGAATLPDGAVIALTDDGFEFGETLCSGTTCVTGGLTP